MLLLQTTNQLFFECLLTDMNLMFSINYHHI